MERLRTESRSDGCGILDYSNKIIYFDAHSLWSVGSKANRPALPHDML